MMYYSVAIDGPAGAGKSTMARRAAQTLGFVYVDTGAIYRAVACGVLRAGVQPEDGAAVAALLPQMRMRLSWTPDGVQHVFLNEEDLTAQLRRPEVSEAASKVSALTAVRQFLLDTQRDVAKTHNVIMDGRDIGTVVLPNADVKIFLSASAEVRARRRWLELQAAGRPDSYEEVLRDMNERDYRDSHRAAAPLACARDAQRLDTSDLSLEESIAEILKIIREKTGL